MRACLEPLSGRDGGPPAQLAARRRSLRPSPPISCASQQKMICLLAEGEACAAWGGCPSPRVRARARLACALEW